MELSAEHSGEKDILLDIRQNGDDSQGPFSPLIELQKKIENDKSISIVVPDRLVNRDKMILAAKDTLTEKKDYIHHGVVHTSVLAN